MFGRSRNGLIYLILTLAIVTTILYFQDDTASKADEIFKRYSRLITNQTSALDVRISEIDISPQSTAETYAQLPLILFWTDKYYAKPQYNVAKFAFSLQCEWKCRYTNDKSKWNESHSVVIREQFPSGEYPPKASAEQRVMILLPEAPGREPVQKGLAKIPKNYMNMTVGYMRSMDIFKPYDAMIKQKTTTKQWEEIVKRIKAKSKPAFIVYSHCNADSEREKYIAELQKYFPVDTFGKCGDGRCDKTCMEQNIKDYHFYIAFENNICEDYITEKFYRSIKKLILPLVLNDSIYRDLVPKNSYIAVDTFKTVSELATYLQFLLDNNEAYLQHFEWTKEYSLNSPALFTRSYCEICRNAHDKNFHRVYEDIADWFGPKRCDNTLVSRLLNS
ncbi:Glyco-tran-10-N domain-containing protein [Aphelenchoides besseyi]|nr:Glyco-tran-10-N domain-containing protein [Aphelenchoides besseyi]